MKKILLITSDFPPDTGGVANYYFNLCCNLPPRQIVVLSNKKATSIQSASFKIINRNFFAKIPVWPRWIFLFWHIYSLVKKEKIQLIWAGQILPIGTVVYYLSKILKLPYIVSLHGTDILSAQQNHRKNKLAQKILFNAKYITCNSQYTSQLLDQYSLSQDKIKIIYPGITPQEYTQNPQACREMVQKYKLENKKIILSVARLVRRKGIDNVIKALPGVWQKFPDLVYVIIGDGQDKQYLQNLINQATQRIVKGSILIIDDPSNEEKNNFYQLSDLFILPGRQEGSDVEGFGIVFLEAALYKKPSIAGNFGGAKEAVIDNQTGLLVEPNNIQQIKEAVVKLLQNDKLRVILGQRAYQRAINEFQWPQQARLFSKLLN